MKFSNSKQTYIRNMLNALEPEEYIASVIKDETLSKKTRTKLELLLRLELAKAKKNNVPLGVELQDHSSLENAYMYRQQYIAKVVSKIDTEHTLRDLLVLVIGALVMIAISLCF